MNFFDTSKSIIENIYFLTAPILLIVAIFGLAQLRIAKYTLRINSKRDAALLSIKLCETYIPTSNDLYQKIAIELKKMKIDYLFLEKLSLVNFTDQELKTLMKDQYDLISINYLALSINFEIMLNELEYFSMPFINKIADEEIAFSRVSLNFLQKVRLSAFFIIK